MQRKILLGCVLLSTVLTTSGCREDQNVRSPRRQLNAPVEARQNRYTPRTNSHFPTLSRFAENFSELAEQNALGTIVGRQKEMREMFRVLQRRTQNNVILTGRQGSGKTIVMKRIAEILMQARQAQQGRTQNQNTASQTSEMHLVPPGFEEAEVMSFNPELLMRENTETINNVIRDIENATRGPNRKLILHMTHAERLADLTQVAGLSGTGVRTEVSEYLTRIRRLILDGKLKIVGETSAEQYSTRFAKDEQLSQLFQNIFVEPLSEDEIRSVIRREAQILEQHYSQNGLTFHITHDAESRALMWARRFAKPELGLVEGAVRFLEDAVLHAQDVHYMGSEQAASLFGEMERVRIDLSRLQEQMNRSLEESELNRVKKELTLAQNRLNELEGQILTERAQWARGRSQNQVAVTVGPESVAFVVASSSRIPVASLAQDEAKRLVNIESDLRRQVRGQDQAVTAVADALRLNRVGLGDPLRPIGSFLFIGPTGVGKTELAKAIAKWMNYGLDGMLIRKDMGEFSEAHNIARLLGSPAGYVGYGGRTLVDDVQEKPTGVLLLDEIEKAHPDVRQSLLALADEGRLTDGQGREANFRNHVAVATSNVGAAEFGRGDIEGGMAQLRRQFSPEFLGRFVIVPFNALTDGDATQIVSDKVIPMINQRVGLIERGITIELHESAVDFIIQRGFTGEAGARQVNSLVQRAIVEPLGRAILEGRVHNNTNLIVYLNEHDTLVFQQQGMCDEALKQAGERLGQQRQERARQQAELIRQAEAQQAQQSSGTAAASASSQPQQLTVRQVPPTGGSGGGTSGGNP